MYKRVLVVSTLIILLCSSTSQALDTDGEVIFRDALYGAAIGAILGGAVYLADQDKFATKFSTGIIIGTIGGLVVGVYETQSFVEIKKDSIKLAVPTPVLEKKGEALQYSASLLKTRF
jgi:hypothetical protein